MSNFRSLTKGSLTSRWKLNSIPCQAWNSNPFFQCADFTFHWLSEIKQNSNRSRNFHPHLEHIFIRSEMLFMTKYLLLQLTEYFSLVSIVFWCIKLLGDGVGGQVTYRYAVFKDPISIGEIIKRFCWAHDFLSSGCHKAAMLSTRWRSRFALIPYPSHDTRDYLKITAYKKWKNHLYVQGERRSISWDQWEDCAIEARLKRKYVEAVSSNNSSWDVTRNSIVISPTLPSPKQQFPSNILFILSYSSKAKQGKAKQRKKESKSINKL